MTEIIVDTNIVFSCLLNTHSNIGDLLLNSDDTFKYYTAIYLKEEIERHKYKLLEISGLSDDQFERVKEIVYSKLTFMSEEVIPFEYWKKAAGFVRDIDMDDIAFVALSLYMDNKKIWTGDQKLLVGLVAKGFENVLGTQELLGMRKDVKQ